MLRETLVFCFADALMIVKV